MLDLSVCRPPCGVGSIRIGEPLREGSRVLVELVTDIYNVTRLLECKRQVK